MVATVRIIYFSFVGVIFSLLLQGCGSQAEDLPVKAPGNSSPTLTVVSKKEVPEIQEVLVIQASDPDGDLLTYSVKSDQVDSPLFEIGSNSASEPTLKFKNVPNALSPSDNNGDSVYETGVVVSDGASEASYNISITVIRAPENNTAPTITRLPQDPVDEGTQTCLPGCNTSIHVTL